MKIRFALYARFVGAARITTSSTYRTFFLHCARLLFPSHRILTGNADSYFNAILQCVKRTPSQSFARYQRELIDDIALNRTYETVIERGIVDRKFRSTEERYERSPANVVHYYALVREMRPQRIVETGTFIGSMTSWLVTAAKMNGSGLIVSIDLPARGSATGMGASLDPSLVGCLVPAEYREHWQLRAGDSRELLPTALMEASADIFIHDSLHTFEHMMFEYSTAHTNLPGGAVIMSDDILTNTAWFAFCRANGMRSIGHISNPNLGFAVRA